MGNMRFFKNNSIAKAFLICLLILSLIGCMAGCNQKTDADAPVRQSEGWAEKSFRKQMADASVTEVVISDPLVLASPVEVAGNKVISGEASITAIAKNMEGDYMFVVPSGNSLTVKGSVTIDAAGVMGGVHIQKDATWTLEENATVKNASAKAANALVEGKLLLNGGTLADANGHNIYNKNETVISGGTITGSGEQFAGVYNEGKLTQDDGSICAAYYNVVSVDGSSYTFNKGSVADSVNNAIVIEKGASLKITSKDASVTGAGYRGIYLSGEAVIDQVSMKNSYDTLIKVTKTGKLTVNDGTLSDAGYHGIDNAGTLLVNGGTIYNSYSCGIVNTGSLEMTGGSVMNNPNKGILNKLNGVAKVTSENVYLAGNMFAIGNEDEAYFELTAATFSGSTNANIYAYGGEMYIHDIKLAKSASNNVRVVAAKVTMENVEILGNATTGSSTMHGLLLEGGSVEAKDLTIIGTTGNGIRNKGGKFVGTNVALRSIGNHGVTNTNQDFTGREGVVIIDGLTVETVRYNNILSEKGTMTLTNAVLTKSGTNNIKVSGGTLNLVNVDVQGNIAEAADNVHGIYTTGGTINGTAVRISNTRGAALRVAGDEALVSIKGFTAEALNHASVSLTKGTVSITDGVVGKTDSNNIRIDGGALTLKNVTVNGHVEGSANNIHAVYATGGKLVAEDLTVAASSGAGIRSSGGNVQITGLKVDNVGTHTLYITNDKSVVTVTNAALGVAPSNNVVVTAGELTLTDSEILGQVEGAATNVHGILTGGGKVNLEAVTITGTSGSGIRNKGAILNGTDVVIENFGGYNALSNAASDSGLCGELNIDGLTVSGSLNENSDLVILSSQCDGKVNISNAKFTPNTETVKAFANVVVDAGTVVLDNIQMEVVTSNSVRVNGGNVTLTNSTIPGHVEGSANNVNAFYTVGGTTHLENVTITNPTGDGLRVNLTADEEGKVTAEPTVTAKNVTVTGAGRHSMWVSGGSMVLEDSTLSGLKSNMNNVLVSNGTVELVNIVADKVNANNNICIEGGALDVQDVQILGHNDVANSSNHGLYVKGGKVTGKDLDIKNTAGSGIRVDNDAVIDLKNVKIDTTGQHGIRTGDAGEEVSNNLKVTIDGLTISNTTTNNILNENGEMTIKNAVLNESTSNNIKLIGGKLNLENVQVLGHKAGVRNDNHGIFVEITKKSTATLNAKDILISNTAGAALRNKGGNVTVDGLVLNTIGAATLISNVDWNSVPAVMTLSRVGISEGCEHATYAVHNQISDTDLAGTITNELTVKDSVMPLGSKTIGIYVEYGKTTVENSVITGAVYAIQNKAELTVNGGSLHNNGWSVRNEEGAKATLSGGFYYGNKEGTLPSDIYNGGDLTIEDITVGYNKKGNGRPGVIYQAATATPITMKGNTMGLHEASKKLQLAAEEWVQKWGPDKNIIINCDSVADALEAERFFDPGIENPKMFVSAVGSNLELTTQPGGNFIVQIGTERFESFKDALAYIAENDAFDTTAGGFKKAATIQIIDSYLHFENVVIPEDYNITLVDDGTGEHTVAYDSRLTGDMFTVGDGAQLNLKVTGNTNPASGLIFSGSKNTDAAVFCVDGGVITLESDLNITNAYYGIRLVDGEFNAAGKTINTAGTYGIHAIGGELYDATLKGNSSAAVYVGEANADAVLNNITINGYTDGIRSTAGKLTVTDLTVNNPATSGIYLTGNGGNVTVNNLNIVDADQTDSATFAHGIKIECGEITVNGGSIDKTSARSIRTYAGAIVNLTGDVTLAGSTGNDAIYVEDATLNVGAGKLTISSASAHGIYANGASAKVNISGDVSIANVNYAILTNGGGSLKAVDGTKITISDSNYGLVSWSNSVISLDEVDISGVKDNSIYVDGNSNTDAARTGVTVKRGTIGTTEDAFNIYVFEDGKLNLSNATVTHTSTVEWPHGNTDKINTPVHVMGNSKVTLDNVTLNGGKYGIRVHTSKNVTLNNVTIKDSTQFGMWLQASPLVTVTGELKISGTGSNGIQVNSGTLDASNATKVEITDAGANGLDIRGTANVKNLTVTGAAECGITASGTVNLSGVTTMSGVAKDGINVTGSGKVIGASGSSVTITGSVNGVSLHSATASVTLHDVTVKNPSTAGVYLDSNGGTAEITNLNVVDTDKTDSNTFAHGIKIEEGEITVNGGSFDKTSARTIRMYEGSTVNLTGEVNMAGSSGDVIYVEKNSTLNVKGAELTISSATNDGILVYGTVNISGAADVQISNAKNGINLQTAGKLYATDTANIHIETISSTGIFVRHDGTLFDAKDDVTVSIDKICSAGISSGGGDLNFQGKSLSISNCGTGTSQDNNNIVIWNAAADIVIKNATLGKTTDDNQNANDDGHNVEVNAGNLTITDSVIEGTVNGGSGVKVTGGTAKLGNVTIKNCVEHGIHATGGTVNLGGETTIANTNNHGIYLTGGTLNVNSGKLVVSNFGIAGTAAQNVAGIWVEKATVNLKDNTELVITMTNHDIDSSNQVYERAIYANTNGKFYGAESAEITINSESGKTGHCSVYATGTGSEVIIYNAAISATTSNNVVATGTAGDTQPVIKLYNSSIAGGSYCALAENGTVYLDNVTVSGGTTANLRTNKAAAKMYLKDVTSTGGYRGIHSNNGNMYLDGIIKIENTTNEAINTEGSVVVTQRTGTLTINTAKYGICAAGNATVNIDDLTISGITTNSVWVKGTADVTISGGSIGGTTSNNILIEGADSTLTMSNVTVAGHKSTVTADNIHAIYVNNADAEATLTNVTVNDTKGDALRVGAGKVTVTNLTINSAGRYGMFINGESEVTIDVLKITGGTQKQNIRVTGGSVSVKNAELTYVPSEYHIYNTATMTLENVTVSGDKKIYNTGTLKVTGKIDADIFFDSAVALNVVGGLADGSDITLNWADGKLPADHVAVNFVDANGAKDETGMNACKTAGYIKLAAPALDNYSLYYMATTDKTYAMLAPELVMSQGDLNTVLAIAKYEGKTEAEAKVGGSFTISQQVAIPSGIASVIIKDKDAADSEKYTITYSGTENSSVFALAAGEALTLKDITVNGNDLGYIHVPAGATLKTDNVTIQKGYDCGILTEGTVEVSNTLTVSNITKGSQKYAIIAQGSGGLKTADGAASTVSISDASIGIVLWGTSSFDIGTLNTSGTISTDSVYIDAKGTQSYIRTGASLVKSGSNNIVVKQGTLTLQGTFDIAGYGNGGSQHGIYVAQSGHMIIDGTVNIGTAGATANIGGGAAFRLDGTTKNGGTASSIEIKSGATVNTYKTGTDGVNINNGGIFTINGTLNVTEPGNNGVYIDSSTVNHNGTLTITDSATKNDTAAIYVKGTGKFTGVDGSTVTTSGTGIYNNIYSTGSAEVTVYGGTFGATTQNNIVAISGGTVKLYGKATQNTKVTGGNHGVLADNTGTVYLEHVTIYDAVNGIRANHEFSSLSGKNVTISGTTNGMSIARGTVVIENLKIRNTSEVGVSVRQADKAANVTLTNLITENCGTYAIHTTGGSANVTINGATLGNDGSDHVVYLNGGPMKLNDVTITNTPTASGMYEIYSGAGFLTIGGAMDADIYLASAPNNGNRAVKVNKAITGNKLTIDWAPNKFDVPAIKFNSEQIMNGSMDSITLGNTQADADYLLYFHMDGTNAVATLVNKVVTSEAELNDYLAAAVQHGMTEAEIIVAADIELTKTVAIPAGMSVTITDDGTARTIKRASTFTSGHMFNLDSAGRTLNLIGSGSGKDDIKLTISGENVSTNGRLVRNIESTVTAMNVKFSGANVTSNSAGFAIYSSGKLVLDNVVVSDNTLSNTNSGAVCLAGGTDNQIKNSVFQNNATNGKGAALAVHNSASVSIISCEFSGNAAKTVKDVYVESTGDITIRGNVNGEIYFNKATELTVSGALSSDIKVDWATAPAGAVITFASEDVMNASMSKITLGDVQSDAGNLLYFHMDGTNAVATLVNKVVTSEAELNDYLAASAYYGTSAEVLIGGNFTVADQIELPAGLTSVTISDDGNTETGNTITYNGSATGNLFLGDSVTTLSLAGITLDCSDKVNLQVSAGDKLNLNDVTVQNVNTGSGSYGVAVNGTLNLDGEVTVDGASWGVVVNNGKVTATQDSVLTVKNADYAIVAQTGADINLNNLTANTGIVNNSIYAANNSKTVVTGTAVLSATGSNVVFIRDTASVELADADITGNSSAHSVSITSGSLTLGTAMVNDARKWAINMANGELKVTEKLTVKGADFALVANGNANVDIAELVTTDNKSNSIYTNSAVTVTVHKANLVSTNSHVVHVAGGANVTLTDATLTGPASGTYHGINQKKGAVTINGSFTADVPGHDVYVVNDTANVVNVAGQINADIYFAGANTLDVTGALTTGSDVTVDWVSGAEPATAITFKDAATLTASRGYITLGATQAAAGKTLAYGETDATLVAFTEITSWADLSTAVSALNDGDKAFYKVTGDSANWAASSSLAIPSGVEVTLIGDANSPAIVASTGVSPFTLASGDVLTLENLTVGGADGALAAQIVVPANATLNLKDSTLQHMKGAVNVKTNGVLNAVGCTFSKNSGQSYGSAVGNWGGISNIADCVFDENSANDAGGAILNYQGGTLTVENSTFTNNSATNGGGAIAAWNSGSNQATTTITGCVFGDPNDATKGNTAKDGGALHFKSSGCVNTIEDCKFYNNSASTSGGAVGIFGSTLTVRGSDFYYNSAAVKGGALLINVGGTHTIENCNFIGNETTENGTTTEYGGGAIMTQSGPTVNIVGCVFESNTSATFGGALKPNSGTMNVTNCVFGNANDNTKGNSAYHGGAIYHQGSNVKIYGSKFYYNSATKNGGAIYNRNPLTIDNYGEIACEFVGNNSGQYGGAIYEESRGDADIAWSVNGASFTSNKSTAGGAICNFEKLTVTNCVFTENEATASSNGGGAIWSSGYVLTVENSEFTSNKADLGGAILSKNALTVTGTDFKSNTAKTKGGAARIESNAATTFTDCDFISNSAPSAGAISRESSGGGTLNFSKCNFEGNFATTGEGGAMLLQSNPSTTIDNCTFTGNTAKTYGGAIKNNSVTNAMQINNSTFTENSAESKGGAIYDQTNKTYYVTGCTFANNTAGDGNAIHNAGTTIAVLSNGCTFNGAADPAVGQISGTYNIAQ